MGERTLFAQTLFRLLSADGARQSFYTSVSINTALLEMLKEGPLMGSGGSLGIEKSMLQRGRTEDSSRIDLALQ